jgi:hypothetical protein
VGDSRMLRIIKTNRINFLKMMLLGIKFLRLKSLKLMNITNKIKFLKSKIFIKGKTNK